MSSRNWSCSRCTFDNDMYSINCQMCGNQKPHSRNVPMVTVAVENKKKANINIKHVNDTHDEGKNHGQPQLKQVQRGLIKCNGDCGSKFANIIDICVSGQIQNENKQDEKHYEKTMILGFKYYNDPLRQSLLQLIKKRQLRDKYNKYYDKLNDKNYIFETSQQIDQITQLFNAMIHDNHKDILQQLANQTCHEPDRSLLEEIEKNSKKCIQYKLKELEQKYHSLQTTLEICQQNNAQNINVSNIISTEIQKLQLKMKEEKKNQKKKDI
eukprot:418971_1